jgi:hypothetical protein
VLGGGGRDERRCEGGSGDGGVRDGVGRMHDGVPTAAREGREGAMGSGVGGGGGRRRARWVPAAARGRDGVGAVGRGTGVRVDETGEKRVGSWADGRGGRAVERRKRSTRFFLEFILLVVEIASTPVRLIRS